MNDFSSRLKKALEMKGMNQSELARRTGLTVVTISRYINLYREPTANALRKMCEVLGVSSDYLLGIDGETDNFDRLLIICKTAGLTTEQRAMLIKTLAENVR